MRGRAKETGGGCHSTVEIRKVVRLLHTERGGTKKNKTSDRGKKKNGDGSGKERKFFSS